MTVSTGFSAACLPLGDGKAADLHTKSALFRIHPDKNRRDVCATRGGATKENQKAKGKSEKSYVQKSLPRKQEITVSGTGVICETRALPGAGIPAKAGIYSASQ
jgi:hypothetical protein